MKKLLLTALCLSTTSAFATSQVLLETPVTYAPDASVVDQIKNECHIEDMLTRHVGEVLRKINRAGDGTIASQTDAGGAKILRLQITHVLGVGGGAWSGPKATTVSADLIEDGKVSVTPRSTAGRSAACGARSKEAVRFWIARPL